MGASTVIIQETPPPNPGDHAGARPGAFRKEDGPPASWWGGGGGGSRSRCRTALALPPRPHLGQGGGGLAGPGNIH